MNAHPGILPVPHPTLIDTWTVLHMGAERTIVREHGMFKALHCGDLPSRDFQPAIDACVRDIEWQAFRLANPVPAPAPLSEDQLWLLGYSDAYDASDRMARARIQMEANRDL